MTGLMNSASAGDPLASDLSGLAATIAPELTRPVPPDSELQPDWNEWRSEVAARLARYRTRRKPRAPRYPSLLLPFDNHGNRSRSSAAPAAAVRDVSESVFSLLQHVDASPAAGLSDDRHETELDLQPEMPVEQLRQPQPDSLAESSAKIIEFPRSAAMPEVHSSALADPIVDRPRIVEAPEVVPPAPALGGILIEPVQTESAARPATPELTTPSASIALRLMAVSVDALVLLAALAAFAAIFLRLNPVGEPLPVLASIGGILGVLLWIAYQFLLIVGTGSTPGLRVAHLRLTTFDGAPVPRRTRRWRVLASLLSGFSAGLGYLWCLLDQDSLCWHDRITRTHLQSARPGQ